MQWAAFAILSMSLLATTSVAAQVASPQERIPSVSERDQHGLHGLVKSCSEENTYGGFTDAEGKTYPPVRSEYTTEYDLEGRITAIRTTSSEGSKWVASHAYDTAGRLLSTSSGVEGQTTTQTYSYDNQGRLQRISDPEKPEGAVTFSIRRARTKEQNTNLQPCGVPTQCRRRRRLPI